MLQEPERPRDVMSTVFSHFEEAPEVLCYRNACHLSPYCLDRSVSEEAGSKCCTRVRGRA